MDLLIFTGFLLAGGLLNFIKEAQLRTLTRIAGICIFIVLVAVVYKWIYYFAGIKDADLLKVLRIFLEIISMIVHGTLGYLTTYILLNLRGSGEPSGNAVLQRITRLTLWAISISIANSFIVATAGKSLNMPYMTTFFKQSGYAVWLLYVVMTAECTCALGILFHFRLKTGPYAAIGLIIILLGAVCTHWHNHDPFSDSYSAVTELINLSLLLLIYYCYRQLAGKHPLTPIYIV